MKELLRLPVYRNTFGDYCQKRGLRDFSSPEEHCEWLDVGEFRCHLFKGRYLESDKISGNLTPRRTWDCKELDKTAAYIPSEEETKARKDFEDVR